MIGKIINGSLLIAILLSFGQYVRLQSTQAELRQEHRRLMLRYGILPVEDPDKFSLRRVEEDEIAHYVWRYYVPEGETLVLDGAYLGGTGQNSASHSPDHGIIRVHIGRRDSTIRIYCATAASASSGSFAYPEPLAEFLLDHWQELTIEVGPEDVLESDLSEPMTLLSVSVPEELQKQAVEQVPDSKSHRIAKRLSEPVLVVRCGTVNAFKKQPQ